MANGKPRGRPPKNRENLRSRRSTFSRGRYKLKVPDLPGYHLHWISDQDGRLEQFMAWGYEKVTYGELGGRDKVGEYGVDMETDASSVVCRRVGTFPDGKPLMGYLCKIPLDLYEAAQDEKLEEARERVRQIKDPSIENRRGEIKVG